MSGREVRYHKRERVRVKVISSYYPSHTHSLLALIKIITIITIKIMTDKSASDSHHFSPQTELAPGLPHPVLGTG